MSIKKIMLLAGMALAALAFALPATASATTTSATILDEGKVIEKEQTAKFSGRASFTALGSGIECEVHVTIRVEKDVNEVTTFEITTSTCLFFGTPYKNCAFNATNGDTVTNTPWVLDVFTSDGAVKDEATLTGGTGGDPKIDGHLANAPGKTCPFTTNNLTLKHDPANGRGITLDLNTNAKNFIDSATITGNITVDTTPAGVDSPVTETIAGAAGTLTIEASQTNTYTLS